MRFCLAGLCSLLWAIAVFAGAAFGVSAPCYKKARKDCKEESTRARKLCLNKHSFRAIRAGCLSQYNNVRRGCSRTYKVSVKQCVRKPLSNREKVACKELGQQAQKSCGSEKSSQAACDAERKACEKRCYHECVICKPKVVAACVYICKAKKKQCQVNKWLEHKKCLRRARYAERDCLHRKMLGIAAKVNLCKTGCDVTKQQLKASQAAFFWPIMV